MYTTTFDADHKVWYGPKCEFKINKHENFGETILAKLSDTDGDRISQIDGDSGETLTKAEIRRRTIRCAQNLTRLGCTTNTCIGIVARNHSNLTPLLFGALCIGAPVSPLDVRIVKDGISAILLRVRPSFIFCDADVLESIKNIIDGIGLDARLFTVNGTLNGYDSIDSLTEETGDEDTFVCAKIEDAFSHIAVISCSSGSTGLPKSIPMSHALFSYTFTQRNDEFAVVSLCFSSFYWFSGIWSAVTSAFKNTRVFTAKPYSTDLFFDLVAKHKVQFFFGPPCEIQAFLKSERCERADLSSLLVCFAVGGFVPSILVQTLKRIKPQCLLLTTYGLTEICGSATCTSPNELEEHPNSGGQLVPGVEMKIINENTGEKCGIGEEGEIYIKTSIPSLGYYKDETATQNSFDDEGYIMTGDLGYFDESGRLLIIGRKKEIFKNCGFAIWPAELESLIIKNPAIKDAAVVNVYDEDIMSDLPAAVVIKREDHSITEDEVYAIVADQLAKFKHLDGGVYFVDEFPMTPSGKIIRQKVKDIAQNLYQQRKLNRK